MNIFKRFKQYLRIKEIRSRAKQRAHVEILSSHGQKKALLRIDCCIDGHKWTTDKVNSVQELSKPIKKRTYCKHCGKYYSEEVYKEL